MPVLNLDLRDGFHHDDVIVYVNDKEAARAADLTTDLTISHAGSLTLAVPEGQLMLRLEVPKQGISASTGLEVADTPYVAASIVNRQPRFLKAKEAIPML